jgi:hypothetical protein
VKHDVASNTERTCPIHLILGMYHLHEQRHRLVTTRMITPVAPSLVMPLLNAHEFCGTPNDSFYKSLIWRIKHKINNYPTAKIRYVQKR